MDYQISVSEKKFQKELNKAQDYYERSRDTWLVTEPLGRLLLRINDPEARFYLTKAASSYVASNFREDRKPRSVDFIRLGSYYRLMDEHEAATQYFEDAYALAKQETGDLSDPESIDYDEMQYLIEVCFLLGKYEETVKYALMFYEDEPNPAFLAYRYGLLAEAILYRDLNLAEKLATQTASVLNRGREPIGTSGIAVTGWDFYEYILAAIDEIKQNQSESPTGKQDRSSTRLSVLLGEDEIYLPPKLKENIKRKARITFDQEWFEEEHTHVNGRFGDDPESWLYHDKMGRIRRLAGHPEAGYHLSQAIAMLTENAKTLSQPSHSYIYLHIGQLHRLLGQPEKAHPFLEKARELLPRNIGDPATGEIDLTEPDELRYHDFEPFVVTCFLLGKYEEALKYGRFLHEHDVDGELIGYQIALLAQARLENDRDKAELVAQINLYTLQEDEQWPPEIEGTWGLGNSFTKLDMYELALETLAEIEGK